MHHGRARARAPPPPLTAITTTAAIAVVPLARPPARPSRPVTGRRRCFFGRFSVAPAVRPAAAVAYAFATASVTVVFHRERYRYHRHRRHHSRRRRRPAACATKSRTSAPADARIPWSCRADGHAEGPPQSGTGSRPGGRRQRGPVRRLRQVHRRPFLPVRGGHVLARRVPAVRRVQAAAGRGAHVLLQTRQHILQTGLLQAVLDKTLRPLPGRHRRVRPGDARQGPRVPRGVFRVLRVRRGAVQGRLLRRARRRGLLSAGLRAAQAPGRGVRPGTDVQSAQDGRPPLAVRAQGPAPEEEERAADDRGGGGGGRVQRADRTQRAQDTAVDVRSHASHRPVVVDGVADLRDVQLVFAHELYDDGRRRPVATATPAAPATAADAHQAHADVVQTPSAAHDEVVLQHQPKPGRQRPETAGAKDRPVQTRVAGLVSKRPREVEKKHHATGEQPDGDRRRVEPEPERAVRPGPDPGTHAERPGIELHRSVLIRAHARGRDAG